MKESKRFKDNCCIQFYALLLVMSKNTTTVFTYHLQKINILYCYNNTQYTI